MSIPTLPADASDADIIQHIDKWVGLLEQRKFVEALAVIPGTDPIWDADLLAEIISDYCTDENNVITSFNNGTSIDGLGQVRPDYQRKEVDWYDQHGSVWYDLNVNGLVSDLTATFTITKKAAQLVITLDDVHMM